MIARGLLECLELKSDAVAGFPLALAYAYLWPKQSMTYVYIEGRRWA